MEMNMSQQLIEQMSLIVSDPAAMREQAWTDCVKLLTVVIEAIMKSSLWKLKNSVDNYWLWTQSNVKCTQKTIYWHQNRETTRRWPDPLNLLQSSLHRKCKAMVSGDWLFACQCKHLCSLHSCHGICFYWTPFWPRNMTMISSVTRWYRWHVEINLFQEWGAWWPTLHFLLLFYIHIWVHTAKHIVSRSHTRIRLVPIKHDLCCISNVQRASILYVTKVCTELQAKQADLSISGFKMERKKKQVWPCGWKI